MSEKAAQQAGYNCALYGANKVNSHFSWFLSPTLLDAWERGNKAGTAVKEAKIREEESAKVKA